MPIRENLIVLALVAGVVFGQGSVQEIPQRSMPVPTHIAQPEYTDDARNSRIEGAVLLQVEVNEKGIPTEAKVIRSLDKGLDRKATEAALKWRFKPVLKNGTPIPSSAKIEINFRILK
jgi:TonB family protein